MRLTGVAHKKKGPNSTAVSLAFSAAGFSRALRFLPASCLLLASAAAAAAAAAAATAAAFLCCPPGPPAAALAASCCCWASSGWAPMAASGRPDMVSAVVLLCLCVRVLCVLC